VAELKTKENNLSVDDFLNSIAGETKRKDSFALLKLIKKATGYEAKMWGTSIVGFGSYHYKYASGHEGDAALVGFSPRKQNFTIYLMCGFHERPDLLKKLGKHKTGKGCLYFNSMADVDEKVLSELIKASLETLKKWIAEMKKKSK
jgi:Domain of unknown function (DU1801)